MRSEFTVQGLGFAVQGCGFLGLVLLKLIYPTMQT